MKILIVAPYYFPYISGMTVYAKRLAEGLAASGHGVSVLTSRHEKDLPSREKINEVDVIRKRVLFRMQRGSFSPAISLALASISKDYDVINIHAPFFEAGLLSKIAKAFNRKVFLTYHCDLGMRDGAFSKTVESLYYVSVGAAAKDSEKIVVNSMDYLESSRLRVYISKGVGIFPPIDAKRFVPKGDRAAFRRRLGIPEDDKLIGFVGRMTYEKGLIYLIEALPGILEKMPETKLLIGGESLKIAGGAKESVKKDIGDAIEKNDLQDAVLFTGYLSEDDLVSFYSSCDVFVLPSIDPLESFGMVQVEAMLCGCPVVASDMPGIRDPVNLTGFGRLVKPKDSAGLSNAVAEVLDNKERYAVTRERMLEFFGTEKTVREYDKLFEQYFIKEKNE